MPDIAMVFNQGNSLMRRIKMIVSNNDPRRLSWRNRALVALFTLVVAPLSLLAQSGDREKTAAKKEQKVITLGTPRMDVGDPDSPSDSQSDGNSDKLLQQNSSLEVLI